jgi:NitT/TauT family transport system substrate-binding protein
MFRRDLADSGALRSPRDLRGMRVALPARGITTETLLLHWLRQSGLSLNDVEVVELGFPDHGAALAGGAVEAIISTEPFITRILDQNLATIYQLSDQPYPGFQSAEVIYSAQFVESQPDAARRFMVAYLRALRYYNDAFRHQDAAKRATATEILARYTPVKDVALYERMYMPGINPDGRLNRASIAEDQEIWLASGLQQARVNLDEVIDESFVQSALQVLGPYR